ncbi:MAG: hypothetical protein HS099_07820 [Ardenticatenaceae bacterium]|nr:hypothetical protein [Ardenticatenaceae bacterium]
MNVLVNRPGPTRPSRPYDGVGGKRGETGGNERFGEPTRPHPPVPPLRRGGWQTGRDGRE